MEGRSEKQEKEFKLIIDQKLFNWPNSFITGLEIKKLAGVDPTYGVWQDIPGPKDLPIGDDQKVHLKKDSVDRFFTGKKTTTEG